MVSSSVSAWFLYGFPYRFQSAWTVLWSKKHPLDAMLVGAWNSLLPSQRRQARICKMDTGNNRHSGKKIKNSEDMRKTVTPISLEELKQEVKKLKWLGGKATGTDKMPNKIFTEAQPQTLRTYQIILNRIAEWAINCPVYPAHGWNKQRNYRKQTRTIHTKPRRKHRMPTVDGWCSPHLTNPRRTTNNAKYHKWDHRQIPYRVWRRKNEIMKIGAIKNKPEFKLGDMKMEYSDCYKYLGLLLNMKNNPDDHIKSTKGKAEAAYQTILSIAGNSNMKNIEMRTIWELISCCIQPTIT